MTSLISKSINYKKQLVNLLKSLNYFSDIKVFFGNNIDVKRMLINDLDKPVLAVCFAGGELEEKSKSQGPFSGINDVNEIYFFILGRNNSLEDENDFSFNCIELEEAKDLIIKTIKENQNYWGLTNNDFNFIRYSYLTSEEFDAQNINILALEANHKYRSL